MNKQRPRGIEWTEYTLNPMPGCLHGCKWHMPDGNVATCYAKSMAERLKSDKFFPNGFEEPSWHGNRLTEPSKIKEPSRIFIDSMGDLMGHWVEDWHVEQVLKMCRENPQHKFQLLTKNPTRLKSFRFPGNVWAGASMPADEMNGHVLTVAQKRRWLETALNALADVREWAAIRWMSFEPLSWDVADVVAECRVLDWAVIGAGTNGRTVYQPDPAHVQRLLDVLAKQRVPVFFKGNLKGNPAAEPWRQEFPE